jgi:ATP-dependent RNA helicase DDX52/ROK1
MMFSFSPYEISGLRLHTLSMTSFQKPKFQEAQSWKPFSALDQAELPPELDFFKYAQGDSSKRKATATTGDEGHDQDVAPKAKRQRLGDADWDEGLGQHEATPLSRTASRHRVVTKGSKPPAHADSFEELRKRYQLSSLLLANLRENGYEYPTGIQSYGIPILLEVCSARQQSSARSTQLMSQQSRDLAAISPTGTGKTLSYLLPMMASLGSPASANNGNGVRALIVAPTRELVHQIHNECLKLAQGRKWRVVAFNKATASTMTDKATRNKVGSCASIDQSLRQQLTCSLIFEQISS